MTPFENVIILMVEQYLASSNGESRSIDMDNMSIVVDDPEWRLGVGSRAHSWLYGLDDGHLAPDGDRLRVQSDNSHASYDSRLLAKYVGDITEISTVLNFDSSVKRGSFKSKCRWVAC